MAKRVPPLSATKLAKFKPDAVNAIFIAVIIILLGLFTTTRTFLYFRDYSIIYDGASRILLNQKPYIDFGLPTGPVVFWLSAFFLKIFNGYWVGLYVAQYFFNIIMLLGVSGIYQKLKLNDSIFKISTLGFSIFYLAFQSHPWYNSTAVMFMFLALFFILTENKYLVGLAGITSALALGSKQDIGLMVLVSSIILIGLTPKLVRVKLFYCFITGFSLILFSFIYSYDLKNLTYWLNFGQHGSFRSPFHNQPSFLTLIALISCFYGFLKKDKIFFVCGAITGMGAVSINTSGLYFTHYYYLAGVLPIFLYLMKKSIIKSIFFGIIILIIIRPTLPSNYFLVSNLLNNYPEHYLFNANFNSADVDSSDMKKCDRRLIKVWAPSDTCQLISDVKDLISKNIIPRNGNILNLSELRVLKSLIGYRVPKGHPLWYDETISLYPKEISLIKHQLESGVFDLILFQGKDLPSSGSWIADFIGSEMAKKYTLKKYLSPSDLTDCTFDSQCPQNIWLMYKK